MTPAHLHLAYPRRRFLSLFSLHHLANALPEDGTVFRHRHSPPSILPAKSCLLSANQLGRMSALYRRADGASPLYEQMQITPVHHPSGSWHAIVNVTSRSTALRSL